MRSRLLPCMPLSIRARLLAWAVLALLAAGGCGLRTPPRPATQVLPRVEDVQVRQRAEMAVLSWPQPDGAERYGGVTGYRVLRERLPPFCAACAPEALPPVVLTEEAPELEYRRGRIHYPLALEAPPERLRVRVVRRYNAGSAAPSAPVLLEPAVDIPAPELQAGPGPDGGVVLSWPQRQAREVTVLEAGGTPTREVRYYRVNVYRARPDGSWPLVPENREPLATPPFAVAGPAEGETVAYTVRYVDELNNEGPPAPVLQLPRDGAQP